MQTEMLRKKFLNYFKSKGHTIVPSSLVVPHDDPTLLFTNAGMNQFKDVFLGKSKRDYTRASTSQKCIRVGGKHNDLENVGHTRRHLTFFEMLGNFSFGDYFKEDAIRFAFEVSTEVFGFNPDRIWPSVFEKDDEAFELWKAYIPEKRIVRFGEKENFWAMGDTGPCGPCSELLYDRGEKYGSAKNPYEDASGERYLEFWNLVFMQFNKLDAKTVEPLPKPAVDTGAGLERILSLSMDVDNVFETDVLRSLIAKIEEVSNVKYNPEDSQKSPAFRVIADHLRCLSFAISDGVVPSNVDRGYVLRKVLRRAVRYGRQLGLDKPFLKDILPRLVETMGNDYKELKTNESRIAEILTVEEESFLKTLKRGGTILNQIISSSKSHGNEISGEDAFKLKDTYGLPFEEIFLLAKDSGLTVNSKRFEELELEAKERSKQAHKTSKQMASVNLFLEFLEKEGPTQFTGYNHISSDAKVKALVKDGEFVPRLNEGEEGLVILDKTPFYAEMGGQVGDEGTLVSKDVIFDVKDAKSPFKGVTAHIGKIEKGMLNINDSLIAKVNQERRQKIANNHTATHLLHWALEKVLGSHIKQAGSVVDDKRLRFDFSHHKAMTKDEIKKIEDLVNEKIRSNASVNSYEVSYETAQKREDIKQFFGDKYDDQVRVIDIDFSKELCGGTHTERLGNIGYFRILKESSIAAGVRRIEAISGSDAETFARMAEDTLEKAAKELKTTEDKLLSRIASLLEEEKKLNEKIKEFKNDKLAHAAEKLANHVETKSGIRFLVDIALIEPEDLKALADLLMNKFDLDVLAVGVKLVDGRCQVLSKISDKASRQSIKAIDLIKLISPLIEGSGGGKDLMAQAGGKSSERLQEALDKAKNHLVQTL